MQTRFHDSLVRTRHQPKTKFATQQSMNSTKQHNKQLGLRQRAGDDECNKNNVLVHDTFNDNAPNNRCCFASSAAAAMTALHRAGRVAAGESNNEDGSLYHRTGSSEV